MGNASEGKKSQLTKLVYAHLLAPPTTKFSPESLRSSPCFNSKQSESKTNRIRLACTAKSIANNVMKPPVKVPPTPPNPAINDTPATPNTYQKSSYNICKKSKKSAYHMHKTYTCNGIVTINNKIWNFWLRCYRYSG